jgi:hypothetical protein
MPRRRQNDDDQQPRRSARVRVVPYATPSVDRDGYATRPTARSAGDPEPPAHLRPGAPYGGNLPAITEDQARNMVAAYDRPRRAGAAEAEVIPRRECPSRAC